MLILQRYATHDLRNYTHHNDNRRTILLRRLYNAAHLLYIASQARVKSFADEASHAMGFAFPPISNPVPSLRGLVY